MTAPRPKPAPAALTYKQAKAEFLRYSNEFEEDILAKCEALEPLNALSSMTDLRHLALLRANEAALARDVPAGKKI